MNDTIQVMQAFQDFGNGTLKKWESLVRLIDKLPDPDRGEYIGAAANLATRQGLLRVRDIKSAFAKALKG